MGDGSFNILDGYTFISVEAKIPLK